MITELIIFFILFLVFYTYWNQDPPDYPPGPFRIPFIGGGMPITDTRCIKLQKKYGDLIMEKIGKFYWLTVCDYKLSKEVLSKTEVINRPELKLFVEMNDGKIKGIGSTNGEHWRTNRRFIMHCLRDSGMGKSILENAIQAEAKEIVAEFNKLKGSTSDLTFLNFAPLNIIWKMVANKRYNVNDPMLNKVQRLNQEFTKSLGPILALDFFPLVKCILPSWFIDKFLGRRNVLNFVEELRKIAQPIIEEHKKNLDKENPKDLMDLYLLEEDNPVYLLKENISNSDLQAISTDLFNAGSDTVSITLRWAIYYMAKYPELQKKMQDEIDSVVPRDILPGYDHKIRLPYCEAVTHEILRRSSLANFGGIHVTSEDISLRGYTIPKGTILNAAVHFIHHDPRYWENPNEFNPDRFLDTNGDFSCPKEGFLPFGSGKRICPGESLARAELYIYITSIFQNFSFSAPDGKDIDIRYLNQNIGIHLPMNQDVSVHSRN